MPSLTRQRIYDLAKLSGVLTYHKGTNNNLAEVMAFAQLITSALNCKEFPTYTDRSGGCFTQEEIESSTLWK